MKTTEFISENELIGQDAQIMHEENKTQSMRVKLHSIAVNSVAIHKLLPKLGKNGIAGNSDIVLYADAINEAESLLQHVFVYYNTYIMVYRMGISDIILLISFIYTV